MAEPLLKDDRPAPPDRKSIPRDESFDKLKEPAKRSSFGRRLLVIAILAIVVITAAIGCLWWFHARNFESTDDAFVDIRIAGISPQVSGAIVAVPVTDNELVAKGAIVAQVRRGNGDDAVVETANDLLIRCNAAAHRGGDFPAVWKSMLRGHPRFHRKALAHTSGCSGVRASHHGANSRDAALSDLG